MLSQSRVIAKGNRIRDVQRLVDSYGERYAYPKELNEPGFFEDFFDQQEPAIKTFWRVINQELAAVPAV